MSLPIRLRLTLTYSALLAGALLIFAVTVYILMANTLVSNLDATLQQRVTQVQLTIDVAGGGVDVPSIADQADSPFIPTVLVTPSGHIVNGRVPPEVGRWLKQHAGHLSAQFLAESVGGVRLASAPIKRNSRTAGDVLVWQSMRSVEDARRSLLLVMAAAGPALLLIAGLGGMALARRALAPVAGITRAASSVSVHDLSRRVPVGNARDELSDLASTFNAMIDRLDRAVQRERQFTGDASHELRSPLAVIRAETTLALERPRERPEYEAVLAVIDDQANAMQELISALLLLARVGSLTLLEMEVVEVADLMDSAIAQCQPLMDRKRVTIARDVPTGLAASGSFPLLTRAVRNLIDNAVKATQPGGTVQIRAWGEPGRIHVSVEDHGPGIAYTEQSRIFDPFYQVSTVRTPDESHGLGLTIGRRIIEAHQGEISVDSVPDRGSTFSVTLPAEARAASGERTVSTSRHVI